jgi:hypothetical protein
MGDAQRIYATRDAIAAMLHECASITHLIASFESIRVALAALPTRPALAAARRKSIDSALQTALDVFAKLENESARSEALSALVRGWRRIIVKMTPEMEQSLAHRVAQTFVASLASGLSFDAVLNTVESALALTCRPDPVRLSAEDAQAVATAAIAQALVVPSGTDDDIDGLLPACRALGSISEPFDAEAHLRLRALMQQPSYDLDACVVALENIGESLTPAPIPLGAITRRQAITKDLQLWVEMAPAALPGVAPYQVPPLKKALDAVATALHIELAIELEPPNVDNDAELAARLAADPFSAEWRD